MVLIRRLPRRVFMLCVRLRIPPLPVTDRFLEADEPGYPPMAEFRRDWLYEGVLVRERWGEL